MARRLEYVGSGRIVDAATRNLVSPKDIVREYNEMSDRLGAARGDSNDEMRRSVPSSRQT